MKKAMEKSFPLILHLQQAVLASKNTSATSVKIHSKQSTQSFSSSCNSKDSKKSLNKKENKHLKKFTS